MIATRRIDYTQFAERSEDGKGVRVAKFDSLKRQDKSATAASNRDTKLGTEYNTQ